MIDFFHFWKTLFKCINTTNFKCQERKSILNRSWNFIAQRESPCIDLVLLRLERLGRKAKLCLESDLGQQLGSYKKRIFYNYIRR